MEDIWWTRITAIFVIIGLDFLAWGYTLSDPIQGNVIIGIAAMQMIIAGLVILQYLMED